MAATYIILMGVQGAGKGTQAKKLAEELHLPHITTGGLFRGMGQDTPLGRQIQEMMKAGHLVPDDITIQVVRERLKQPDTAKGAIFDGFPRTRPQAEALDTLLKEFGGKVTVVPFFNLPREVGIRRITDRMECSVDASHVYNLNTNPPRVDGYCDIDNALLKRRADDTPEAAARRIDLFYQETGPLFDYYRQRGVLVEIDADQPIETVTEVLKKVVNAAVKHEK